MASVSQMPGAPRREEKLFSLNLGFAQRLSTRLVLLQVFMLALVLTVASTWLQRHEVASAQQALRDMGRALLPFLGPSIRPAVDLAVDELTGTIDRDLLQGHIIEAAFATARQNPDLVYADFILPDGDSVGTYWGEGVAREKVAAAFAGMDPKEPGENLGSGFIEQQMPLRSPDDTVFLGTVRIAFSLRRAEAGARHKMLVGFLLGGILFLVVLGLTTSMSHLIIYRPMTRLLSGVRTVAQGRLNTPIEGSVRSEIGLLGRAFAAMANALRSIVVGIKDTSSRVSGSVGAVQVSAQRMLDGAREQSAAVERVLSAVQEVDESSRTVDGSIDHLSSAAEGVARSTTLLSQSLNQLTPQMHQFRSFVGDTNAAMQDMASSANDIASQVTQMTDTTDHAAAVVVEFERALATIGTNSGAATELAEEVRESAEECRAAVSQTIVGMAKISDSFASIDSAVAGFGQSADAISQIVRVIGDITNQTKLLSLNASILASQAGEHGKGFAVVADEIKALSERTNNSTREIATLVDTLEAERVKTGGAMTAGIDSVKSGEMLSRRAGEAIAHILDLTERSHLQIAGIAAATTEQATGSRTITEATHKIADMGRRILQTTGRQRHAAQEIAGLSAKMVQSLEAVDATLRREADNSTRVVQSISQILQRAEAVQRESSSQRSASARISSDVHTIKVAARRVLAEAERLAQDMGALAQRVERLSNSIQQFEVD